MKILHVLRRAQYVSWIPVAAILSLVSICINPFVKVRFDLVPMRFGTMLSYQIFDILNDERSQISQRERRPEIRLSALESPVANRFIYRWFGGLAGWVPIPRSLMIPTLWILRKLRPGRPLIRRGLNQAELISTYFHEPITDLPAEARELAARVKWSVPQIANRRTYALIVREEGDLLSKQLMTLAGTRAGNRHAVINRFRNCSIESYRLAIDSLVSRDAAVIRVGNHTDRSLHCSTNHYWEYANSEFCSDVGDVAVASLADACISCSTGLELLYRLLDKPVFGVNVPWVDSNYRWMKFVLPKHPFVNIGTHEIELPLIELAGPECDWSKGIPLWKGVGVEFRDNTPEEICEALLLADKFLSDTSFEALERELCKPLWSEFWQRAARGNMRSDQTVEFPTIALPMSARARFFEVNRAI